MLKLEQLGIRSSVPEWISALLSSCTQQEVVCGGCHSDPVKVLSSVPHGTVLGPLLFLMHINDISGQLTSTCHLMIAYCIGKLKL